MKKPTLLEDLKREVAVRQHDEVRPMQGSKQPLKNELQLAPPKPKPKG